VKAAEMAIGTKSVSLSAWATLVISDLRWIQVATVVALACWGQREMTKHAFKDTAHTTLLDLIQSNDPVTPFEALDSRTNLRNHTGNLMTTCDRKVLNEEPAGSEDVLG
jgi:L-fucose isomerase-like protein